MTALDDLRKPLPGLRALYWSERAALVLCGVCLVYFVFGKLAADWRLGLSLWNKLAGVAVGFAAGLLFATANLLHLRLYGPRKANFAAATEALDQFYAAQGFKPIPPDVTELVTDYERYLEPAFFSGSRGYVIGAVLGGLVCLGSVAVLNVFP